MALTLVADIGGTHARFALAEGGELHSAVRLRLEDGPGFAEAAANFLDGRRVERACLAAAGPLKDGRIEMTNRGWTLDAAALSQTLDIPRVEVMNDFAALALSLPHLGAADLERLGGGAAAAEAPRVICGPGTGLGVAALLPGNVVVQGEGGHIGLAAQDDREARIIDHLRERFPRVSAERILSGPGMANLHGAIAALDGATVPKRDARAVLKAEASCPVAAETVARFVGFLGAFAGDIALVLGARGGVFLAGGVAQRLAPRLLPLGFRTRFEAKGRMRGYVAPIPAAVVTRDDAALLGLARMAAAP